MHRRRIFIIVGVSLCVIAAALVFLLFSGLIDNGDAPSGTEIVARSARFTRPVLVGYEKGVRRWSLQAESIEEASDDAGEDGVTLTRITEGILFREGEPELRFVADEGTWHQSSDVLHLSGNITFYQDDQEIRADRLSADMKAEKLHFYENVLWLGRSGMEVRADEAIYLSEDQTVEFLGLAGPVTMIGRPE